MLDVYLTYFFPSGAYFADAFYSTQLTSIFDIAKEVLEKIDAGKLPGAGGAYWIVLVRVPAHEHFYPFLLTRTRIEGLVGPKQKEHATWDKLGNI